MIRAILACDEDWGIGKDGSMPWPHNRADLQWFKKMTYGYSIVMGRNTWNSLPVRPLPGRQNIVVSTTTVEGATYTIGLGKDFKSQLVDLNLEQPLWIIGGGQLIEGCLDIIDEIWLSRIEGEYNCDVKLPSDKILEQFVFDSASPETDIYVERWVKK
jgi:dihydrofolate reductase